MPRPHQVTIPRSAFTELQHFLSEPDSPSLPMFRLTLGTLLAPMIRHIRLFQTTKDELPNVLEWSIDAKVRDRFSCWEPASLTAEFEQVLDAIEKFSCPASVSDVDLFLGFSVNPSDRSLSIDVTTGSVLEGQDIAALAAASAPETPLPVGHFDVPRDVIYLTADETAKLLGVAKSTITRRVEKNELIGFRVFKNALRIPKDQFKDGDVVDGIADILAFFKIDSANSKTFVDHKAAWVFLASTIYPGHIAPRPIDRLRTASPDSPISTVLEELSLAKKSLDYGDHI